MKQLVSVLILQLIIVQSGYALDYQDQIKKAMTEYIEYDNTSSAVRRLSAILEEDPENLEANWLYVLYTQLRLSNTSLENRIENLREAAPAIKNIVALAEKQGNTGFARYVLSQYADDHYAFDRAINEIDKAIESDPDSVRYIRAKANIMINKGRWEANNDLIYSGIDLLKEANDLAGEERPVYFTEWRYHFDVAFAYGRLVKGQNCPQEAIDHYMAVVNTSPYKNQLVAYAWNNVSCAYRKLGQCDKARDASENALEIMKFGAARTNLRYSEYCLQMQKLGLYPETAD